jgi:uncharacterized protein
VDFLIKKGTNIVELIQVCYDIENPEVEKREIEALIEASKELKVGNLTVLTWDENRVTEKEGIIVKFKTLKNWLLEQ